MFGGGGGLNPRKMEKLMEQMGVDMEDIDAEEVIIRTSDEELVFDAPEVMKMDARGQETYQIVGSPDVREAGAGRTEADDDEEDDGETGEEIPDADVEIVAQRTGVSEDEAREALEATGGDLAAAVERLE
ncbi:MAG TPA: nascent polypeptide-associated complex protein [Natrialbaceae archaeon]|nr:nascent polypeptide-associated complex protein [Natrialbaceae archaeon]